MRQLTSLDAQFLNVESARIYGHVAFLGIYDPSTAPGGNLGGPEVKLLLEERLHLLPPLRWRLVEVPLGLDLPVLGRRPGLRPRLPRPRDRDARRPATIASSPRPSSACSGARWTAARPLWEFYVIHGLEDGRVALLTKIHHSVVDGISGNEIMAVLLDPEPEGARIDPPPAGNGAAAADPARPRDARPRPARASRASRCGRCARCRRPSPASPTCRARTRCPACRRSRTSTRGCGARSAPTRAPTSSR